MPVPEYFGVYAVVDGHLMKLDGQGVEAKKLTTVRMGQRMGVGDVTQHQPAALPPSSIQVPELPADLKIIVYAQSGGAQSPLEIAKTLHLESLVFVRTLTIDAGWPSGIKRSDRENGWDAGGAVELAGTAGGQHASELEFLMKPMPGHQDMVIAGLAEKLKPGVYRLTLGRREFFMPASMQGGMLFAVQPVSQGENDKCVDSLMTYAMTTSNTKYTPCSGAQITTSAAMGSQSDASLPLQNAPAATTKAACADYDGCMQMGQTAFRSSDWPMAISSFQAAANQHTTNGDPWVWLGRTYLRSGQNEDVPAVWNKAFQLGGTLIIGVCHERSFQPCERGDLSLSTNSVAFLVNGSQTAFSVPPSQVNAKGVLNNTLMGHASFGLQIDKKKYNFEFLPLGVTCQIQQFVQCPQEGTAQQLTVANYLSRTVPALASGALGKPTTPSRTPVPSQASAVPSAPTCSQSADAGYSLLLQGRLYKVGTIGPAGPNQVHLFIDDKDHQVTDSGILQQLTVAAWARDNIVVSADARGGARRVSGILGTSKALQNYSNVQDALARGMVEAVEAVVTDGASLSKVVPTLTGRIVMNQLKAAPKTIFVLAAQVGLQQSLAAYNQMDSAPMPPADATVLNAPDLIRIEAFYLQARTLELPYEALAAKLMPTTASQLTNQAFVSAISEIIPSVGFNPTQLVTLNDLLTLQKSVANLADTLPATQAYSQNLKLALELADANNRSISQAALIAAQPCGQAQAAFSSCPAQPVQPSAGSTFGIMRSTDGGKTWARVVSDSGVVDAFLLDGAGRILAGTGGYMTGRGMHLGLLESSDDGMTWVRKSTCGDINFTDIRGMTLDSTNTIYAAGGSGVISGSDSSTWKVLNAGLDVGAQRNVQAITHDPLNRLIAGTYDGVVRFDTSKQSWTGMGLSSIQITSLISTASGQLFAGTGGKGLFRSSDNGIQWRQVAGFPGTWVSGLATDSRGNIFAAAQHTGVVRSNDAGRTWKTVLAAGKDTAAFSVSTSQSGGLVFASVGACCPVATANLFQSADGGATWTKILDLTNDVAVGAVTVTGRGAILVGLSTVGE